MSESHDDSPRTGFLAELTQRRVVQAALVYFAIAWTVTEVISFLLNAIPLFPDWVTTVVAVLFVLGFPVAMFLAWRFDIDRHGVHRTEIGSRRGKVTIGIAIAMLAVSTAGLTWLIWPQVQDQAARQSAFNPPDNSIAVMPFINVGDDPDNAFFAVGLPDTVLHKIANLRDLIVIARTSSFALSEGDKDAASIGRELNAKYLLEGSVQSFGNEIRVIAQLIETPDASHVWSLDRRVIVDDIFDIQDEIALEIADALKVSLRDEDRERLLAHGTDSVPAYLEYLRGNYARQSRSMELFDDALRHYEAALELDQNYARAHLGIGETYFFMGAYGVVSKDEARRLQVEHVDRAIEIDPELGAAWAKRAQLQGDGDNADPELVQKAIALNPNDPDVLLLKASLECDYEDDRACLEQDIELLHDIIRRSPDDASLYLRLGFAHLFLGDTDGVLRSWSEAIRRNPNMTTAYTRYARALFAFGNDGVRGIACLNEAIANDPNNFFPKMELASIYIELGLNDMASRLLDEIGEAPGEFGTHLDAVRMKLHIRRGELQEATAIANALLDIKYEAFNVHTMHDVLYDDAVAMDELPLLQKRVEAVLQIGEEGPDLSSLHSLTPTAQGHYALALARIYRTEGKTAVAEALRDATADYLHTYTIHSDAQRAAFAIPLAQIHLWRGDVDAALGELELLPDEFVLNSWYVNYVDEFAALANNPRFEAVLQKIDARLKQDREAVLAAGDELPDCVGPRY